MFKIENILKNIFRRFGIEVSRFSKKNHPLVSHDIDLLFDIGANTGQYGKNARKMGYKNNIVSFEPLSSAYKILERYIQKDPKWLLHEQCAIGAFDERRNINISKNSYSSSILDITSKHTNAAKDSIYIDKEEIKIIPLDSIYKNYARDYKKIFVKIDTQGFESEVLEGAKNSIKEIYGFQIELSIVELYKGQKLYNEILGHFKENNFVVWNIIPGFFNNNTGQLLQFEAILLNKQMIK